MSRQIFKYFFGVALALAALGFLLSLGLPHLLVPRNLWNEAFTSKTP